ncbi:hypothetical protein NECAME_13808 [Necator americanus]|uniref:ERAP1-like C-terminal domain-containing protein n=1 Tax=Necator americanus TaxID=51031 RepID=W2SV92_NECAM|nr:hypothetical protein NECAME_13808 [Necator americanus]ETN72617.1 hypothetical protein NECAME_13808 [Necator americanus]
MPSEELLEANTNTLVKMIEKFTGQYYELAEKLMSLAQDPNLHWRHVDMAPAFLSLIAAATQFESANARRMHYLKKFSFKNTCVNDLWQAFDDVVEGVKGPDGQKLNMVDFGSRWSKQMGFPLVTVKHLNSTTLKIIQERYMKVPHAVGLEKYRSSNLGYKWDVPLWYQWDDRQVHYTWLKRDEPLYIHRRNGAPIVINVEKRGYFIQNYDAFGWEKIAKQLIKDHKIYDSYTRYTIINDAFAAALIDRADYQTVFSLLIYLPKEQSNLVIYGAKAAFETIQNLFDTEEGRNLARISPSSMSWNAVYN